MLFHGLCFQLASLVEVPTAAEISGTVVLVDTTISKEGMKRMALLTTFQPLIIVPLVYFNYLSEEIGDIYKLVIMFLYLSTAILSFASYKSLNEKSYTGVMAATGLSYLSLIVSIGASGTLLLLS